MSDRARNRSRRNGRSQRPRRRLLTECLEDRRLLAVSFEFNYINDNTIGFNDPVDGSAFQSVLEAAATRIGDSLLHDAVVEMDVFSQEFTGTAIAKATSEPPQEVASGGFFPAVIPDKIINAVDPNGDDSDGLLEVFFFDAMDTFTYALAPGDVDADDEIDFQAVIIHELVHTLGFTSFTNADGSDDNGNGLDTPGTWSLFDRFLTDSDGNRLIDADENSDTAFEMNEAAWSTHSVGGPGPDGGLFFDGPIATATYGQRVPLFSPSPFQLESSVAHLDSEGFPDASSNFSPLNHLMTHAIVDGVVPQELTLLEKAILADIGINVAENSPPIVSPPTNIVVEANTRGGFLGTNQAIADFLAGATAVDSIDPAPEITNNKPTTLALGLNRITFTATDLSGNVGTATAVISVFDTTPPELIVTPSSVTFEATGPDGVSDVVLPFSAVATDIVDANPVVTFSGGTSYPIGTTNETYSARDFRNNVAAKGVSIVVADTTPPQFTLPTAFSIDSNLPAGADLDNLGLMELLGVNASDLVDAELDFAAEPEFFPIGTTSITFRVVDDSGNASSITSDVTVNDVSLVVTTLDDELDDNPESSPEDLSLREAISLANSSLGPDNIRFADGLSGNILIDSTLGQLEVTDSLTILGLGIEQTQIDGQDSTRVLDIRGDGIDVTLSHLTIRGGQTSGDSEGGAGIRFDADGELTLEQVRVANNSTTSTAAAGGGIQIPAGDLTLIDSEITGNQTSGEFASGGGIWTGGGNADIQRSSITGNSTSGNYAAGGGFYALDGVTTMTDSTVSGNSTNGTRSSGGGVALISAEGSFRNITLSGNSTSGTDSPGGGLRTLLSPAKILNSTISGNSTDSLSKGGGLFADRGDMLIGHSTITSNSGAGAGGGVGISSVGSLDIAIHDSILAGNTDDSTAPDLHSAADSIGTLTVMHTLIGDNSGTGLGESQAADSVTGNIVGDASGGGTIDPLLGELIDNGGPTLTHLPQQASLAVDSGNPDFNEDAIAPPLVADQRGDGFERVIGGRIDMGAVERMEVSGVVLTWNDPEDISFGTPLSSTQLNATANVPGSFAYVPPAGVFLSAAPNQVLTVIFTPSDESLDPISTTVQINVNKATPVIDWADPVTIVTGTPLSSTQLNASANVTGSFVFTPPLGTLLDAGLGQTLSATFTPENTADYNIAQAMVSIDVLAPQDFGDAPESYPVTLAQDGAHHLPGNLLLGSTIDSELDGQTSDQADGDGEDEDGMTLVADPVAVAGSSTIASWLVEASESGKLDAWIDFNSDGDWDDDGEQVHSSLDVSAGDNLLAFTVPAGATSGVTFARLRISSEGNLQPTGGAADGEVEDYQLNILDGAIAPQATVQLVGGDIQVATISDELVVLQGGITTFRVPRSNLDSVDATGRGFDQTVHLDLGSDWNPPAGGIEIDGDFGGNTIVITGTGGLLDLTEDDITLSRFRRIDLSDPGDTELRFDLMNVVSLSPMTNILELTAGEEDQIVVRDAPNWRMAAPIVVEGRFVLTAQHADGGGETIQADVPNSWQNFLSAGDVNNDGQISASDALRIINELGRREFSDADTQALANPLNVASWPGVYFDHNGDQQVTALDALRVINDLARLSLGSEPEPELPDLIQQNAQSSEEVEASSEVVEEISRQTARRDAELRRDQELSESGTAAYPKQISFESTTNQVDRDALIDHDRQEADTYQCAVDELLSDQAGVSDLLGD